MLDRRYLRGLIAGFIACFYLTLGAAESNDSDDAADEEDSEESSRGDVE